MFYFTGCVDIKKCKCKLQLSNANDIQELIIGKDKSLNVSFTLANVGEEPSLGSKIGFVFPIHLKLIESPEYGCSINGQRDYDMPTETQVSRINSFSSLSNGNIVRKVLSTTTFHFDQTINVIHRMYTQASPFIMSAN